MNTDINAFYYSGRMDSREEMRGDIQIALMTRIGRLFYDRGFGNGVATRENEALGPAEAMLVKYDVATCMARRNKAVPRRLQAVVSQSAIDVTRAGDALDIEIRYMPAAGVNTGAESISLAISEFS